MSDVCQRCGEDGEDRRTIWMACFYEMNELDIPFETKILFYADIKDLTPSKEPTGIDLGNGKKLNLMAGTVKCSGELTPHGFYTLRVCKECRAKWMEFQKIWWTFKGTDKSEPTGTGVFIRENGTNRELTLEEVVKFRQERGIEPARVKSSEFQKMIDKVHWMPDKKLFKFHDELEKQSLTDEYLPGVSVDDCLQEVIKEKEQRKIF